MRASTASSPPGPESTADAHTIDAPESRTAGPRRLVAIGGGTGLAVVLRGLKHCLGGRTEALTAVVTVADDGGSSGRLRRELGVLPPGDIRNCIVALADDEDLMSQLFQYRFPNGGGLSGHSFGNLFLTALTGITGDFYQAILTAEEILAVRGRILPATLSDVRLRGLGRSGRVYEGESAVGQSGEELTDLALDPPQVAPFPRAVEALENADLVVLGPGSLYTSVLPNLLIPGIRQAIRRSGAPVVLISNLMTQPGETDAMSAQAHFEALRRHTGERLIDQVLINSTKPPQRLLDRYADTGSELVTCDRDALERQDIEVVARDLLAEGDLIRHDPTKLADAVLSLVHSSTTRTPDAS